MAIYSTGRSVSLGAQHRMEQVPITDADGTRTPAVGTDMLLRSESVDTLPAVSGEQTGSSPIFDLLNRERPGVITLEDATSTTAVVSTSHVALHDEQLRGHATELRLADPTGLSAGVPPLELGTRVNRSLVVAEQVPAHLGRLARAELTAGSEPEFAIARAGARAPSDIHNIELLGPSFQEMSGNGDWLRLLALSDHPLAPFAQLSLAPIELGPSITGQLDHLAQKRIGFLG